MKKVSLILVLSLLAALLVGCGGGAAKAEEPSAAAPAGEMKAIEVKTDADIFPLLSDVYTGGMDWTKDKLYIWNAMKIYTLTNSKEAPAGNEYLMLKVAAGVDWFGWGLHPGGAGKNLKDYQDGAMKFWMKMPADMCDIKILIKHSFATESWIDLKDGMFGYKKDNQWHEVIIPITAWTAPKVNMKSVQVYLGMAQGVGVTPKAGTFYMDEMMFVKGKAMAPAAPAK